ncbi:TAT-binding protein-like protein 7, AAA ATPase [Tilletia horrida]|nr:TAT-binding protein-like protein 7, AAA ATPase [Tilletia horrida]
MTRTRNTRKVNYNEDRQGLDDDFVDDVDDQEEGEEEVSQPGGVRSSGRSRRSSTRLNEYTHDAQEDEDEEPRRQAARQQESRGSLSIRLKRRKSGEGTKPELLQPVASGVQEEEEADAQGDDDPIHASAAAKADMSALAFEDDEASNPNGGPYQTRARNNINYAEGDDESDGPQRPGRKSKTNANASRKPQPSDFECDTDDHDEAEYGQRKPKRRIKSQADLRQSKVKKQARRTRKSDADGDFELSLDDSAEEELDLPDDDDDDLPEELPASQGTSYALRQRKQVNYYLPVIDGKSKAMPDDLDVTKYNFPRQGPLTFVDDTPKRRQPRKKAGWNGLPATMSGKDYAKLFGDGPDSSDDDVPTARRVLGAGLGGGAMLGGMPSSVSGLLGGAGGLGAFGGAATAHGAVDKDAQLGRIKPGSDGLADVDPFGPNMQVDFSSIGGLDSHVQQLKEMVSLPLLYPELFTRFKVTPPRGVLFHGPPGTGKTLVARALAASCSTDGQQISFFMRKGADCLSKWVGEAERQLRLLFEEAKNAQPSIIFFDEIDGLAPVRSSKQDQIHASIVSILLALMDGMDGRGQVVVIGATNRPDSVDPALRRPGRFDREFYFPLPDRKARREILNIHTRGWEPPLSDDFKDRLAEVTKGYGGADLRALCTEAALNAIQRRYPQIYKTNDRLLLEPESIHVDAKDFMMSVNKVVPSSKRAGAGSAAALPEHFQPLLGTAVAEATRILDSVMPPVSKRNALEEAMYEDEAPADLGVGSSSSLAAFGAAAATARAHDGGFGRELLLQSFETLRVFKPRVLIHGEEGMGQSIVGAAILHHLEGYHVQPLDIATLLGDSSRTPEAAVIQIFQEAKRHKPSVMYIPGIIHWANSVPEGVRTTLKSLLDSLSPSDPVMLLAVAEGPISELRRDVRNWFGFLPNNKYEVHRPGTAQRQAFFSDLLNYVARPPTEFPDGVPRRKRVLEDLPVAPPKPKKEPSKAELEQLQNQDERTLEHLKFRLSPVLSELRKKFKRFCRDARLEYNLQSLMSRFDYDPPSGGKVVVHLIYNQPIKGVRGAQLVSPAKPQPAAPLLIGSQELSELEPMTDVAAGQQAQVVIGGPAIGGEDVPLASQLSAPTAEADVSMVDASSQQTATGSQLVPPSLAITTEDAPPPSTPVKALQSAESLQVPGAADALSEDAPASGPPAEAFRRDMTIWLISLDKMHTRLFNSYYLTAEEFLDDVQKLVSNAEEAAEVDEDRVTKAYEMRTLALILIEQFVDPAFRLECAKAAKRIREREAAAAREAKDKATKESAGAELGATQAGAAQGAGVSADASATASGSATDATAPSTFATLKRGREDENGTSGPHDSDADEAARKRQRQTPQPIPSPANTHLQANGQNVSSQGVQASPARNGPMGMDSLLNGSNVTRSPSKTATQTQTFEINHEQLGMLANHMVTASADFTIDQLEQLRASAFNTVWQKRSDWNRTALIQELWGMTNQVADALRQEREEADRD